MTWMGHITCSIAMAIGLKLNLIFSVFGSVVPDLLERMTKGPHREKTHSFVIWFILAVSTCYIPFINAFFISAFLCHICIDMMSAYGVPVYGKNHITLLYGRIRNRSLGEIIACFCISGIFLFIIPAAMLHNKRAVMNPELLSSYEILNMRKTLLDYLKEEKQNESTMPVILTNSFTATVTDVIDGDTIVIQPDDKRVRLIGIDCPEKSQEWGQEAKKFTSDFCLGKNVTVESDLQEYDLYGRILAYIYVESEMLNEQLVRQGYAEVLTIAPNIKYKYKFMKAQEESKNAKKGFWQNGGLSMSPSKYRKQ